MKDKSADRAPEDLLQEISVLQKKINEKEEWFWDLFNNMSSGVAIYEVRDNGDDFVFKAFNEAAERIDNLKKEDIVGKRLLDIFPSVREFGLFDVMQRVWKTGQPENFPISLYKDERVIGWRNNYVYKLSSGEVVAIYDDVTDEKKFEEALKQSEQNYREIFNATREAIFIHDDKSGKILDINQATTEMYGYSREEACLLTINAFSAGVAPYTQEQAAAFIRKAMEEGPQVFEWLAKKKSGEGFFVEVSLSRSEIAGKGRVIAVVRDISERKKAENALRDSEEQYRMILNGIGDAVHVVNKDLEIILTNTALHDWNTMLGLDMDPVGKNVFEVFPFLKERIKGEYELVFQTGESLITEEHNVLKGQEVITETRKIPIYRNDSVIQVITVIRNVTGRKRTFEALKESETRYRTLFESSSEGILIANIETKKFLFANTAICRMLGYSEEELLQLSVADIHPEESLKRVVKVFEAQARGDIGLAQDMPCLRKDGTVIYTNISTSSAVIDGVNCNIGFFTDITNLKRMEEELIKEKRMEAVGLLAGGVAHDFNNLLTVISGNIQLVSQKYEGKDEKTQKYFDIVDKYLKEARRLSYQLLTFSKGGEPIKQVTLISEMLKDMVMFSLHGSNVRPVIRINPDLYNAEVDRSQFNQVVCNLIFNAMDAMPRGGHLYVNAENIEVAENEEENLSPGKYLKISFKDEGSGIEEEDITRIFSLFYSTKRSGRGLGLAICHSIIKKHGGNIIVKSQKGEGALFTVFLPATEKLPEDERRIIKPLKKSGALNILIMDDDPGIIDMIQDYFQQCGFLTAAASNGKEALDKFNQRKAEDKNFDICILDMTVPGGMGGKEAFEELKKIDPDVKAILMTGYSRDQVIGKYKELGFKGYILKPFDLQYIHEVVEKAIKER